MRTLILALLMTLQFGCSATPRLFRQKAFDSVGLAEAVNHFVALGEDAAVQELRDLSSDGSKDIKRGYSNNERVGWVCRILFQSKGDEPLRPPGFGANHLPYYTMPIERWPLYPVALSGSTYFVLSEGYMLAGRAEDPRDYINYCRRVGVFRKTPVVVPFKVQAIVDVTLLKQSFAWKAIKWEDSGENWNYTFSEDWVWEFVHRQAETIR